MLINDSEASKILKDKIIEITEDKELLKRLSENAKKLSKPEAANLIAKSAIKFATIV